MNLCEAVSRAVAKKWLGVTDGKRKVYISQTRFAGQEERRFLTDREPPRGWDDIEHFDTADFMHKKWRPIRVRVLTKAQYRILRSAAKGSICFDMSDGGERQRGKSAERLEKLGLLNWVDLIGYVLTPAGWEAIK